MLLDEWRQEWKDLVKIASASTIHFNHKVLTKERVAQLVQSKLPVLAYTVNDPSRAKELLQWGVAAVFSDNPKEIIKAL